MLILANLWKTEIASKTSQAGCSYDSFCTRLYCFHRAFIVTPCRIGQNQTISHNTIISFIHKQKIVPMLTSTSNRNRKLRKNFKTSNPNCKIKDSHNSSNKFFSKTPFIIQSKLAGFIFFFRNFPESSHPIVHVENHAGLSFVARRVGLSSIVVGTLALQRR